MGTSFLTASGVLSLSLLALPSCGVATSHDVAGESRSPAAGGAAVVDGAVSATPTTTPAPVVLEDLVSVSQPAGTQDESQEGYTILFVDPDDDQSISLVIALGADTLSDERAVSEISTEFQTFEIKDAGSVALDGEDAQVYTGSARAAQGYTAVRAAVARHGGRTVLVAVQRTGTSADTASSAAEKDFLSFAGGLTWNG